VKTAFKNIAEGHISFGKPRKRRLGYFENDLKKMGVRGWRKVGWERGAWKLTLKGDQVLHGSWNKWRILTIILRYEKNK
jgi:hypothetical protein